MEISKKQIFVRVVIFITLTFSVNFIVFGGLGWLVNWAAAKGLNFSYVGISVGLINSFGIIYIYKKEGYY